jgi:hypothetical protein
MQMIEAIKTFEAADHRGTGSAEYTEAIASFEKVDFETLEDVSSMIAIGIEVARAGHVKTGLTMIERAMQAHDERLRRIRPPHDR